MNVASAVVGDAVPVAVPDGVPVPKEVPVDDTPVEPAEDTALPDTDAAVDGGADDPLPGSWLPESWLGDPADDELGAPVVGAVGVWDTPDVGEGGADDAGEDGAADDVAAGDVDAVGDAPDVSDGDGDGSDAVAAHWVTEVRLAWVPRIACNWKQYWAPGCRLLTR